MDDPFIISAADTRALEIVAAIRAGDTALVGELVARHPKWITGWIVDGPDPACATPSGGPGTGRTLLHIVTDWPGHFPNGPAMVRLLAAAGADVSARGIGGIGETPLHWAASSDDVPVLDALLDAGADIEADGAVIAGGTAIADATAFGNWHAARRLVDRGARSNIWESAVLGLVDRVEAALAGDPRPDAQLITEAFWGACHGGQRPTAELLLGIGADLNWVSTWDGLTPFDAAVRSEFDDLAEWLADIGAISATTD